MFSKYIVVLVIVKVAFAIYPYFDTQDFIYNVPKVYRISITLDKILDYYEETFKGSGMVYSSGYGKR